MKNVICIDIDDSRKDSPIIIKKPESTEQVDFESQVILDMACICEALCTMIHIAEKHGVKKSPDSLRDCIKHLQDGFSDANYEVIVVNKENEKQASDETN